MKKFKREEIIVRIVCFLGEILKVEAVVFTPHYLYGHYSDDGIVGREIPKIALLISRSRGVEAIPIEKL